MPDTAATIPDAATARFRPGTVGFTVVMSFSMAMTALAIDTILPAFPHIRAEFGYAPTSTTVSILVPAFMAGLGLGQIPAGILADRFGRRPVLWGGIAIYIGGAVAALLAPSLPLMIAARVVWGLGGAGPRVASLAMVRDAYSGEAMARQMSSIMAVFLIVPMIAPTIGSALVHVGPWQLTIIACIAVALVVAVLSSQLPATMNPGDRHDVNLREVIAAWRTVMRAPGSSAYLVSLTVMFAAFMAYIGSSEAIIDESFGLAPWFPAIFGGVSLCMAIGVIANGRIVERVGLSKLNIAMTNANLLVGVVFVVVVTIAGGNPSFAVFIVLLTAWLLCTQVLQANINAAAMVPLGHVAGMGTAIFGLVQMVVGSLLASWLSSLYHGSVTPFAWAFLGASVVVAVMVRRAVAQRAAANLHGAPTLEASPG